MHYTPDSDKWPCSLQVEHQSANVLNVSLLMQKLHASTYVPHGYMVYTLSAAELYIHCNHDAVCAALFNSPLLKQLQARLQNKINSCSGVIVSTCLSCE